MIHGRWSLGAPVFEPSCIRRIPAVRNENVGDVLCCTPAIRALRKAFPKAYLAARVVRHSRDAITGNPDLDEVSIGRGDKSVLNSWESRASLGHLTPIITKSQNRTCPLLLLLRFLSPILFHP
jgi:hypothetical protein